MYRVEIVIKEDQIRMDNNNEIELPLIIRGWNFEDLGIADELDTQLRDFLLNFVRTRCAKAHSL